VVTASTVVGAETSERLRPRIPLRTTSCPVAQKGVAGEAGGETGQLVVRSGILGRKRSLVSAPTTVDAVTTRLADGVQLDPRAQASLEEIREALLAFNAVQYSRSGEIDASTLDAALERGTAALRRLRVSALWPVRTAS